MGSAESAVSYLDYVLALADDAVEESPESAARLSAIRTSLSEQHSPQPLSGNHPDNPIIASKKAQEALFAALEERGVHNPRKLTEFEVYARLEEYSKRAKPNGRTDYPQ